MENVIIESAEFYLNNNFSVAETAIRLEISKSTLQKRFQKLAELDPELFTLVRQKQKFNQSVGRVLGGENGKRKPSYTADEANRIADVFIANECTLDELSGITGIPHTTLYEMLTSKYIDVDKRTQIEAIFQANRHHMTVDTFLNEKGVK